MLSSLFNQWVEGLSTAYLLAERHLRQPNRFRLRLNSNAIHLFRLRDSIEDPVFSTTTHEFSDLPRNLLNETRNSAIEIIVPAPAIMERRLDPLPAESLQFIDNVVLHQIESIFPWRSSDILHSTTAEKRSDGSLDVRVRGTSRLAIKTELAFVEACKAGTVIITAENQGRGEEQSQILAPIGPDQKSKLNRVRSNSRFAIVALLVTSVCVFGWTTYVRWSLSSDVATLDQAIADRRALLKRSLNASDAAESRGLEARKKLASAAVIVLDQLSSILPDGTYLTDLTLEGNRLRITGISSNAVELVPLLEKSGQFRNASFYAPTTRLSGSTSDRFSIEATMSPQLAVSQ